MDEVSFEEWCIQCDIRGVTHFITMCDAVEAIQCMDHVSKFLKQLKSIKFNLRSNHDLFTWYIIPLDFIKELKCRTDSNIIVVDQRNNILDQGSIIPLSHVDEVFIYYKNKDLYFKLFSISYTTDSIQNMNNLLNDTLESIKQYAIDTQNVIDTLKQLTHKVE